jgi:hypothetical protein
VAVTKNGLKKLHLALFVYGDKYLEICTSIVLPNLVSLISEIPASIREVSELRVLTDPNGSRSLETADVMGRIRSLVRVRIDDSKDRDSHGGYIPMIKGQARLVHEASLEGAGIIFCPPDLVWSRGSFAAIVKLACEGYRAVIGPSARGIEEDLAPIFRQKIADSACGRLDISSVDLTSLLFAHWQKMNDGFIWNLPRSNQWKSYAYWRVGERQFLMKCWQGPALFLWPNREVSDYDGWIDHRLIKACARKQSEIYVVADANEIQTVDLAPRDRQEGHAQRSSKRWDLFLQLLNRKRHCRYNILYGRSCIRIYDVPLAEKNWLAAERKFGAETHPSMFAAIALRPIVALADGFLRHSRIKGALYHFRAALKLRARLNNLKARLKIRTRINAIRGNLRVRTRINNIRARLKIRMRLRRFYALLRP